MNKKYEIMFIVRPNVEEEARKQLVEGFSNAIAERNSEILSVEDLGNKTLAYEIDDLKKGYYYIINTNASVEAVDEFERLARINEDIIRFIVIKDEQ